MCLKVLRLAQPTEALLWLLTTASASSGRLEAMYRYRFTSTVEDLLEAEEAERSAFIRGPFRWVIVVLGLAWLVAGLATLVRQLAWQPLVWTCLGSGVLYYFVVRPYLRRRRITTDSATRQDLTLEFTDDGLNLGVSGVGQFTRQWNELVGITDTDKGILFYFSDGVKNWLPSRVFASQVQKGNFVEFLKGHQLRQEEMGDASHTDV